MAPRKRWILYSAVVVVGGVIGAGAVFLVGSAQRRHDRDALVRYERDVLAAIREGGRIVEQEMKPSFREINEGEITGEQLAQRAAAWRTAFASVRSAVLALDAPGYLGDINRRWAAAVDGYAATADALAPAGRAASAAERDRLLDDAAAAGNRADDLFDRASEVIQFHRRRLGLEPSRDLPDPAGRPSGEEVS